jgi:acyl-CoA thioester hydrolase
MTEASPGHSSFDLPLNISGDLPQYRLSVPHAWIDENNHMNAGYYAVAVQGAGIAAFNSWDYGDEFRRRFRQSSFVVEAQIIYLRELKEGDPLLITTRILELDHKRIQILFEIFHERARYRAAFVRQLILHVDMGPPPKSRPMPAELHARLAGIQEVHARIDLPIEANRILPRR